MKSSPHARRILLVDDDAGVRDSINNLLTTEGYDVVNAVDGRQAMELAAVTHVDLVLLDLTMPVQNGWETFEQLSREHPTLPVALITAKPNQLFSAAAAGVGALLEKPIDIPDLLQTVRRLLNEPPETTLARLAGRKSDFYYKRSRKDKS